MEENFLGDSSRKKITTLQVLNVVSFVICISLNGYAASVGNESLGEISKQWDIKIDPAPWAFSIWGLIYSLILVFVVYQALPANWVSNRNEEVIFGQVSYSFSINMILNGVWLLIFTQDTPVAFILGGIEILWLLISCLYIMIQSQKAQG